MKEAANIKHVLQTAATTTKAGLANAEMSVTGFWWTRNGGKCVARAEWK